MTERNLEETTNDAAGGMSEAANTLNQVITASLENPDVSTASIVGVQQQTTNAAEDVLDSFDALNAAMIQVNANNQFSNLIANNTIENVRQQNNLFNQEIANKRRMTEINTYYSNRNTQINFIMRNLVIILVVVIIITVLSKKGIIPKNIAHFSTVVGVLGIIIYIIYNVYDLSIRDRFNFAQYKIPFSEESRRASVTDQPENTRLNNLRDIIRNKLRDGLNSGETCIGDECCMPGTIYDIERNVCIKDCGPNMEYNVGIDNQGNEVGTCDPI